MNVAAAELSYKFGSTERLQVVKGTAALYKCSASITYPQITYPPTINDAQLVSMVGRVAEGIVGHEKWQIAEHPSMAAEDFAWLGSKSLLYPLIFLLD